MTASFTPKIIMMRGRVNIEGEIGKLFPLFSPKGERKWVPEWDPEQLYPVGSDWEEGQIFRTLEDTGEAVWIVSRLDRGAHRVAYYRVEPAWFVVHISIDCRQIDTKTTEATVTYSFIGLSEEGNREIAAMSSTDYEAKMEQWGEWIGEYLAGLE